MSGIGHVLQMNARGPQDTYLTGTPAMTFFKFGYSQHTPFAVETIRVNFSSPAQFGGRVSALVPRRGDLLARTYLVIQLPPIPTSAYTSTDTNEHYWAYADKAALACISQVSLEINGVVVDAHTSEFLDAYDEVTSKNNRNLWPLIGGFGADAAGRRDASRAAQTLHVPLGFFFSRSANKGLPVTSLNRQEVRINVTFRARDQVVEKVGSPGPLSPQPQITDAYLLANVVWLDPAERATFSRPYELLIDTVQSYSMIVPAHSSGYTAKLDWLSHPIKEILFVFRQVAWGSTPGGLFDYSAYDSNDEEKPEPFTAVSLYVENQERMGPFTAPYCSLVTNYEVHSATPDRSIYTLAFALDPESGVPSGSCNFSALSNCFLKFVLDSSAFPVDTELIVWGRGVNVLSLGDGYATVRYAN